MNIRCLIPFFTAVVVVALPVLVVCKDKTSTTARTDRIQLWEDGSWYLLGVNYPWLNYAHDFGATAWGHDGVSAGASKTQVDADFAYLRSQRVRVVRWFLFGDCRAAPEFDPNGTVTGFDEHFYPDMDAALAIAEKHGIYLIPVLLDFRLADGAKNDNGVQLWGRAGLITNVHLRQSFLDNALKPLLDRYGKNRSIIAWDVVNEPEGAMAIAGGKWVSESVNPQAMQTFVEEVVNCIHAHSSQHATLGSASRQWLSYWKDSKLDFYQFHYYDNRESQAPLDYPCANLKLDRPCIVGEFPTRNTKRTMTQYLDTIWKNGYAGALAWSYRGTDDASGFRNTPGELATWVEAHSSEVGIRH
ncbi:MAG: cellulase family glycosylhydrolase [Sedimentisphaerales bacterium]|nr:cellulase family glycosylhydrolase [Sedimentisphaerales bacterium]